MYVKKTSCSFFYDIEFVEANQHFMTLLCTFGNFRNKRSDPLYLRNCAEYVLEGGRFM